MPFKHNNKIIKPGYSFTIDGVTYPSVWLQKSTEAEKKAIGITWEKEPRLGDPRYYWEGDINNPKPLEDTTENEETSLGLKSSSIIRIKNTAKSILSKTDWYIVRKYERDIDVPEEVLTQRENIRSELNRLETAILNCSSVEELQQIVNSQSWPE